MDVLNYVGDTLEFAIYRVWDFLTVPLTCLRPLLAVALAWGLLSLGKSVAAVWILHRMADDQSRLIYISQFIALVVLAGIWAANETGREGRIRAQVAKLAVAYDNERLRSAEFGDRSMLRLAMREVLDQAKVGTELKGRLAAAVGALELDAGARIVWGTYVFAWIFMLVGTVVPVSASTTPIAIVASFWVTLYAVQVTAASILS